MASKTISVQEGVYDLLVHQKLPGESFSQMFRRKFDWRRNLRECVGLWSDVPDEEIEAMKAEVRRSRSTFARDFDLSDDGTRDA